MKWKGYKTIGERTGITWVRGGLDSLTNPQGEEVSTLSSPFGEKKSTKNTRGLFNSRRVGTDDATGSKHPSIGRKGRIPKAETKGKQASIYFDGTRRAGHMDQSS